MLIAHKLVDVLTGRSRHPSIMELPGAIKSDRARIAAMIEKAEKFDFGHLMLEKNADESYKLPELTADEREFWASGLIPLPFPLCWYEFTLGESRSGLLITQDDSKWFIERLDFNDQHVLFDEIGTEIDRDKTAHSGEIEVILVGNKTILDLMKQGDFLIRAHFGASGPLAVYLTLMLNSKTTQVRTEHAPPKLQRAQVRRGHTPLPDHRVVRIVPDEYLHEQGPGGVTRRSPRLHWRRSHLRHLPNGNVIVIARMLVGKAELGEVSHEYRIGK
jgi:hypothetical protein